MAGSAFAGEKMIAEENRGGASGSESGLQHIYFFIPAPTVTATPATPTVVVTREATREIQASEVRNTHLTVSPSISALPAGENEEPTVKVEVEVEVEAEAEAEEEGTGVQDYTLNNAAHFIQGEPISQAEGSLEHIYFFISSAPPTVKEDNKNIKNSTLTVFEIPTIIITAASAAPSRAPSQVGTEEDGEEAPAADSTSEVDVKKEEEKAAPAEQTPTEAGNHSTDHDNDHVGKKLKTDMDSSVNVGKSKPTSPSISLTRLTPTTAANPSSPSRNRSPYSNRKYYHKKKNYNGKRSHRTPSPNNDKNEKPYETDYTSPSGQVFTTKDLNELRFGVKNERGDTVFFKPSFIEDPWVAAKESKEKKEESERNEGGDVAFFKPSFIEDPWVSAEENKGKEGESKREAEKEMGPPLVQDEQ